MDFIISHHPANASIGIIQIHPECLQSLHCIPVSLNTSVFTGAGFACLGRKTLDLMTEQESDWNNKHQSCNFWDEA